MCTKVSVRSHQLAPGEETLIDVVFETEIDGPGEHGEVIDIVSNDPASQARQPMQHDLSFNIQVEGAAN